MTSEPVVKKKRGRKTKDEFYKTKKVDVVNIGDDDRTIHLPISLEDCQTNTNLDRQIEIMMTTPELTGYTPEKKTLEFSEVRDLATPFIDAVSVTPVYKDQKVEIYDLTLNKKNEDTSTMKTDINCWHCCHNFTTTPVHLPTSYRRGVYKYIGIFCSYNCCYTYAKNTNNKDIYLLNYLFKSQTKNKGKILDYITPAPPKETLKIFGGPLSIEEFRNNNTYFTINTFPMVYVQNMLVKKSKISVPQERFKVLPPSKKYTTPIVKIPNNSLSKILGIVTTVVPV
jgi:hypothetical protein